MTATTTTTGGAQIHPNDMIPRHLDLPTFLRQPHHSSPVSARFMPVIVLVSYIAVDHDVHLIIAVGVDVDGLVVAVGDVRSDGAAEGADFWV